MRLLISIFFFTMAVLGGEVADEYQFGRDRVPIAKEFALPDAALLERWNRYLEGSKLAEVSTDKLPVRDGVRIFWEPRVELLIVRERDIVTSITSRNLGYFAREIKSADDCTALILLLHRNGKDLFISSNNFLDFLKAKDRHLLPFKVFGEDVESESISRGCRKDGEYWLWHFLIQEGGSIVEYKYVIDGKGHISQFRRVLIEGPTAPISAGDPGPSTWNDATKRDVADWNACVQYIKKYTAGK